MRIEFVGGARTVTGSCYIVKDEDFTIMVDCGMFQGRNQIRDRNNLQLIYAPPQIDSLLLTHAHIDHSGLIPKLVKEGFAGKIYATKPTSDLCKIMLPDSALKPGPGRLAAVRLFHGVLAAGFAKLQFFHFDSLSNENSPSEKSFSRDSSVFLRVSSASS